MVLPVVFGARAALAVGSAGAALAQPAVAKEMANFQYKSVVESRRKALGVASNKELNEEYEATRKSMELKSIPLTQEAQEAGTEACPLKRENQVKEKAERRKKRQELIRLSQHSNDPNVKEAGKRLEQDMDVIEKARLYKHVYLKYEKDEYNAMPEDLKKRVDDAPLPNDLKEMKDSAPVGFLPASAEDLKGLKLTDNDLAPQNSSFRAAVYRYDPKVWGPEYEGKYAVSARGSTLDKRDWDSNFDNGVGLRSPHYDSARSIGEKIKDSGMSDKVEFTGHSLGGGLAQQMHASAGGTNKTTTFNSAGIDYSSQIYPDRKNIRDDMITAYRMENEALTAAQERDMTRFIMDPARGKKTNVKPSDPELQTYNDEMQKLRFEEVRKKRREYIRTHGDGSGYRHDPEELKRELDSKYPLKSLTPEQEEELHGMDHMVEGIEKRKTEDEQTLSKGLISSLEKESDLPPPE